MRESRTFGVAAEMAFWLFLALLPMAAVVGALVARMGLGLELARPLVHAIPDSSTMLENELARASASVSLTPFGAAAYVWLASNGFHAVFDGFDAQTKVEQSWIRKRGCALLSCIALTIAGSALGAAGWALMRVHVGDSTFVQVTVSMVVVYAAVAWLYRIGLPESVRATMPLWPGTSVVVVATSLSALGYGAYLHVAGDGSVYLAGLAVTAVTMTLLYLFAFALLLGLVVNRTLAVHAKKLTSAASP